MAVSKKPRKKRRTDKPMQSAIKRLVMTHLESMPKLDDGSDPFRAEVIGCRNMSEPTLWSVVKEATKKQRPWVLSVFALYETPDGENYTEEEELMIKEPVFFEQLQSVFTGSYDRVRNAGNPKHLKDYGWVARPYTKQLESSIRKKEELAA